MKRFTLIVLTALILSACTPKAYTESFDAGKTALLKGNYEQAINTFENALEEKETDEAQNYLHIAQSLQESETLYKEGNFESAIYSIKKLLKGKAVEGVDKKIIKQANSLLSEIQKAKTVSDTMKEKMVKGKTLLAENQYDEAAAVFKEIAATPDLPEIDAIETIAKDASTFLAETTEKKKAAEQAKQQQFEEEQAKQKLEEEEKVKEKQKQETANYALTHEQAEELVKKHLNIESGQNIKVVYDHDADNGDYVIHVYEFVVDNPATGEGHTATWGWYGVNKQTKSVYDAMN